ncbi:MAG: type II toxin-antitoxin system RelE/ParE family toxin [bacterium]
MSASVTFSPTAQTHVETIGAWWRTNRLAAPDLLAEELAAAIDRLALSPLSGHVYEAGEAGRYLRLLLQRSRYHVYYRFAAEDDVVCIHAVWHTARGDGPELL